MHLPIKVGSRASKLATVQVDEILRLMGSGVSFDLTTYKTQGDIDKVTSLTEQPGENFFTDVLDEALLKGDVDITIHSAKDLPKLLHTGLEIFALTKSIDDSDAWASTYTWNDLPQGAKVGTSSLLRQKQVKELRPDVQIVNIRGTIEERLSLVEQGKVDGVILATCALKRLGLEEVIRDVFPWEGMPLQGQLAVVGRSGDAELKEIFEKIDARLNYGKVTLAGAGPGDPDLITIKSIQALEKADCVFYDYLVDSNILKYAPKAEHTYAGKRKGDHTLSQDELSRMVRLKAMEGKNVVRLKGGDPLIFGRGADEILYLSSYHIKVSVIPGISSATGIPSYLGVPLTARGVSSSVAFVSGHEEDEDKKGTKPVRIPTADTVVFLMGITKLKEIVNSLRQAGWSAQTPMLIISQGTRIEERIVRGTLEDIEGLVYNADLKPPALIIAGNTVNFYKEQQQKNLLHCGTNPELYTGLGRIISWPMIELKPVSLNAEQQERLKEDFARADMIILTSPTAVEHFMKMILELKSFQEIHHKIFAVIGKHTWQVLEEFGVTPQIISTEETAQGFFKTLVKIMHLHGKKILFPRSSLPNPFLKESLENQGALVSEWTIYSNTKPKRRPLPDVEINSVIFTSPSTVKNFLEDYETIPANWEILSKGPVTEATLKDAGYSSKVLS